MTPQTAAHKFLKEYFGEAYANDDALVDLLDEYASHFDDPLAALERLNIHEVAQFTIRAERRAKLA